MIIKVKINRENKESISDYLLYSAQTLSYECF